MHANAAAGDIEDSRARASGSKTPLTFELPLALPAPNARFFHAALAVVTPSGPQIALAPPGEVECELLTKGRAQLSCFGL